PYPAKGNPFVGVVHDLRYDYLVLDRSCPKMKWKPLQIDSYSVYGKFPFGRLKGMVVFFQLLPFFSLSAVFLPNQLRYHISYVLLHSNENHTPQKSGSERLLL